MANCSILSDPKVKGLVTGFGFSLFAFVGILCVVLIFWYIVPISHALSKFYTRCTRICRVDEDAHVTEEIELFQDPDPQVTSAEDTDSPDNSPRVSADFSEEHQHEEKEPLVVAVDVQNLPDDQDEVISSSAESVAGSSRQAKIKMAKNEKNMHPAGEVRPLGGKEFTVKKVMKKLSTLKHPRNPTAREMQTQRIRRNDNRTSEELKYRKNAKPLTAEN